MVTAIAVKRILCGVEVDSDNQPLKAFSYPLDLSDDYQNGAYRAYTGLRRLTQKHSAQWKEGYADQLQLLPKNVGSKSGRAIAWNRYCGGETWHMTSNY